MSKAVLTLKIWDDRRKPDDLSGEDDLQISTMDEGQFRVGFTHGDAIVISSQQAREISRFLASNTKAED